MKIKEQRMAMIPSGLPFGISDDSAEKQTKRAKSLHKESAKIL